MHTEFIGRGWVDVHKHMEEYIYVYICVCGWVLAGTDESTVTSICTFFISLPLQSQPIYTDLTPLVVITPLPITKMQFITTIFFVAAALMAGVSASNCLQSGPGYPSFDGGMGCKQGLGHDVRCEDNSAFFKCCKTSSCT